MQLRIAFDIFSIKLFQKLKIFHTSSLVIIYHKLEFAKFIPLIVIIVTWNTLTPSMGHEPTKKNPEHCTTETHSLDMFQWRRRQFPKVCRVYVIICEPQKDPIQHNESYRSWNRHMLAKIILLKNGYLKKELLRQ